MSLTDTERIAEWFQAYSDSIHNFLVYFTGSRDVEDLVSETFLRALRGMARFQGKSTPKVWLYAIARNAAADAGRKRRRIPILEELSEYTDVGATSLEETVIVRAETREILNALGGLNENYRNVIILRCIEQLSIKETAQVLGWSESKVNVTYHRALKRARLQLEFDAEGGMVRERG